MKIIVRDAKIASKFADKYDLALFNMLDYVREGQHSATGVLLSDSDLKNQYQLHAMAFAAADKGLDEILAYGDGVIVASLFDSWHQAQLLANNFLPLPDELASAFCEDSKFKQEALEAYSTQNAYLGAEGKNLAELTEAELTNKLRDMLTYLAGEAYEAINMLDKPNRRKASVFTDSDARQKFITELADVQLYLLGVLAFLDLSIDEFEDSIQNKRIYNKHRSDHNRSK